jgi:hypothetical protein
LHLIAERTEIVDDRVEVRCPQAVLAGDLAAVIGGQRARAVVWLDPARLLQAKVVRPAGVDVLRPAAVERWIGRLV